MAAGRETITRRHEEDEGHEIKSFGKGREMGWD
jgi:hypothetical protein